MLSIIIEDFLFLPNHFLEKQFDNILLRQTSIHFYFYFLFLFPITSNNSISSEGISICAEHIPLSLSHNIMFSLFVLRNPQDKTRQERDGGWVGCARVVFARLNFILRIKLITSNLINYRCKPSQNN